MLKQAFRMYSRSLSLKKKEDTSINEIWLILYSLTLMGTWRAFDSTKDDWNYFLRIIPFFLLLWQTRTMPVFLPKNLFLIPMQEAERKKFASNYIWIKIMMPACLAAIIQVIAGMVFGFHFLELLMIVFTYISMGITVVSMEIIPSSDKWTLTYHAIGAEKIFASQLPNIINLLNSAFFISIFPKVHVETSMLELLYIRISLITMLILDSVICKQRLRSLIEKASIYEGRMQIKADFCYSRK